MKKDAFSTFQEGIRREWALTNGIGGYAGSSLIGAHNRTHQGYLIASLHPPIERYLVFSKINESLSVFAAENTGSSDEKISFHYGHVKKKDLFQLYLQCITSRLHSIRKMAKPVTHRGRNISSLFLMTEVFTTHTRRAISR